MQLEQYTWPHITIYISQVKKNDDVFELLVYPLACFYEVGQPSYLKSNQK